MSDCIFCKIVRGEIPSQKVHEDEDLLAFNDIRPVAPIHFMIIPKQHVASLYEANRDHQAVLGKMLAIAGELALKQGAKDGFRTIINTGRVAHQEVYHLHMHVVGGPDSLGPMILRKK